MRTTTLVCCLLLAGCPVPMTTSSTSSTSPSSPAPEPSSGPPVLAKTLAAPTHPMPATLTLQPYCQESGYLILGGIAEGQPFTVDVSVTQGCVHVSVLKGNGSSNDMPQMEVCADSPKKLDAVGQQGRTFVRMNEAGPCKNTTVTMAVK
jgi:hypothetical protein